MPIGIYKRNEKERERLKEISKKFQFKKGHKVPEEWKKKHRGKRKDAGIKKITVEESKIRKNFINGRYRARKRQSEGSHTFGEWELLKKQYGYICPSCKREEPKIQLSEDHIIPLSKGGSDFIENIQPLCIKCNCVKRTQIIKYNNELR